MSKPKAQRKKKTAAKAPVTNHGVDHGHESRVDEMSEEKATHQNATPWVRASNLDAPDPRDGMIQRWVRRSLKGADDPKNLNRAWREGWRPRDPATLDEEWNIYATFAEKTDGMIVVDDLILMEIPSEVIEQRKAASDEATRLQMVGVEHDLESSQVAGHPITREHKSSVSFPSRKVAVAADD